MSCRLEIKKQDGSMYWAENFNDIDSGNAWLVEEQTRPYWDATYTSEFIDTTPPPPSSEELALAAALKAAKAAMSAGQSIIEMVSIRNASKGINTTQTLAFVQAFAGIMALLQVGALETAKEQVLLITPNELVTQDDLDYVVGLLTAAIGG